KTRFNTSLTEMGQCHSITILDNNQTTETESGGLQLILDAQTDEIFQMPIDYDHLFSYPLGDGFHFFLEEPEMHTYRSSHAITVAPGKSIFAGVFLNKYKLAHNCRPDWEGLDLDGYNTNLKYQARDCKSKCIAKEYNKSCSCAPLVFDIDS
ncbi:hypothetical protein PFISCL1PPCAC_2235, partial [Pristionchus fissidentatus]